MNDKFHLECAQENIQTADRWLYHAPNMADGWVGAGIATATASIAGCLAVAGHGWAILFALLSVVSLYFHARECWNVGNRIAECRKEMGYARERLNKITKDKLE